MTGSYVAATWTHYSCCVLFLVLRSSVVALTGNPVEWSIYVTSFYAYSHSMRLHCLEDRGSKFPRNIGTCLRICMSSSCWLT